MRRWWVLLLVFVSCGDEPAPGPTSVCAAAGDFWPTMTLAVDGDTAWVACKEESRIVSLDGAELALEDQAIAVLSAFDAIWALDSRGGLYRDEKVANLGTAAAYNLWSGADSVWSVDDRSGEVIRVDPESYEITKIAVGDGPADIVFDGEDAWVINHRDRRLIRIDTRTNRTRELAKLGDENMAPERMALLDGSLWITGRGADLFKVDPDTGDIEDTIEIGGSGIDIVAAHGALWVPSRSETVDQSGLPTMEALRRVDPDGTVTDVRKPSGRVDVHGLVADDEYVWLADNTAGRVYRIPLDG